MIKNVFIYGFSPKVLNIFTQMLMSKIDLYIFTSEKPYFIILLIILIKHLASYYKPQYLLQYQSDKCFNGTVVNPALPSSYSSEQLFFEIFVLINTFLNTDLKNVEFAVSLLNHHSSTMDSKVHTQYSCTLTSQVSA